MGNLLSEEEIEMLAKKYQKIRTSESSVLKSRYKTFEDFMLEFIFNKKENKDK